MFSTIRTFKDNLRRGIIRKCKFNIIVPMRSCTQEYLVNFYLTIKKAY